ncbi:MAG: MOSC domain-containing protein, partial [Imperialibacter sp.]
YLFISDASLKDLNDKLEQPIPMNRFRPNIVVANAKPFEEDTWRKLSAGDAIFHCLKPCARCQIPTIDQETGKMGKEPTKTLAAFRKQEHKILFGMNAVVEKQGVVKVGDVVTLL